MRVTAQVVGTILVAAVPAVVAVALADLWASSLPASQGGLARIAVVALALVWIGMVAIVGGRVAVESTTSLLAGAGGGDEEGNDHPVHGPIAEMLTRRDRQLQLLASGTAASPITSGGGPVAHHVVTTAQTVTGDRTWQLAVLGDAPELPPGVYDADGPVRPAADLHQWAALSSADTAGSPIVADGPWGAFLIVRLQGTQGVGSHLLAPWEGRPAPSGADRALLSLIAEHASIAIDHAILFARAARQADDLQRLSRVQQDFLRGVTHDLQSPLASISAIAGELRQRGDGAAASEGLETIEHQAERLRRMVVQLLTMSGLEAGVVAPRTDVFRSEPVVQRVIRSMRLPPGRIAVSSTGPDRLAVADPDRLEQVLWAVIDNAVKYSPSDSAIDVELHYPSERSDGEEIRVVDRGAGMTGSALEHAFDQFYRAPNARELAPNGSGIGLYTARGLVRLMGGSLELESSVGRGTVATIRLPAELAEPA